MFSFTHRELLGAEDELPPVLTRPGRAPHVVDPRTRDYTHPVVLRALDSGDDCAITAALNEADGIVITGATTVRADVSPPPAAPSWDDPAEDPPPAWDDGADDEDTSDGDGA